MAGDWTVCGPDLGKVGRLRVHNREAQRCRVSEIEREEGLRHREIMTEILRERETEGRDRKERRVHKKNRHGEGDP